MPTRFSRRWRSTFGEVEPARTAREVEFLVRQLPLPKFADVLDVPCGNGRHMRAMRGRGYHVVGVDNDALVVAEARAAGLDAREGEMRALDGLPADFDAVVCMWASFGYFAAGTNERVLASFARRLRHRGRLVLDVYDRRFFETHHGEIVNRGVRERKIVRDGRLTTELDYGEGVEDVFEWQLYLPEELAAVGERHGLALLLSSAGFDETQPPSGAHPRIQLVFELERTTSPHPHG